MATKRRQKESSAAPLLLGLAGIGAVAWIVTSSKKASAATMPRPAPPPSAGPPPPVITPPITSTVPTGIATLPEPYKTMVDNVLKNPASTATDLESLARALDAIGQSVAADQVRTHESSGTTSVKYASNPEYQWPYIVKPGDSAALIATKIVGDDRRYPELILANPQKPTNGKAFPQLNWVSLNPNERILIPRTWNDWIAQDGTSAGSPVKFLRNPAGYTPGEP